MKRELRALFALVFFFFFILVHAGKDPVDSLRSVISSEHSDTAKARELAHLAKLLLKTDPAESRTTADSALKLCSDKGQLDLRGDATYIIGETYNTEGKYHLALKYLLKALDLFDSIGYKRGMSNLRNSIGNTYLGSKNYDQALKFYTEANKIAEDNGIDYMVAITDFGLSNVLSSTGKQRDAITHLMKAQAIFEAQGNASLVAAAQTNIGQIDYLLGAYDEAGKQLKEALIQQRKDEDDYSIMSSETTLAGVYIKSNELDSALTLLNDALRRAKNLGANDNLKDIYQALSDAYNAKGNSHLALEYYKLYSDAKDSVFNAENNRALLDVQAEYENDKKESELQDQMKENRNKTMLLVFVSCGLLLVMLVAFLIYSRSRVKHKANVVLEQAFRDLELKSAEVVEKNKEITDSIEYAKRIQETFLVPENHFRKLVQDYFIFYRPRDIVSGDFYWSSKVSDHNIFAVADCTGHGVPGAFMSVICNDFMNQVIRDLGVVSPELILRLLDEKIKHLQGTAELKDGMDIALISIDTRTDKLYFAGAHRPLVIIRNGELIELKGAKCSIGEVTGAKKTFPEQEFQLQKGDCVYLFSDGFAHQFGGPKGKKFKYRRLLETLQEMYKRPMNEQGSLLTNVFNEWKSGHEQVDDVCVLGLRL